MKYRKEIDGLRALAVLPVIFFHAGSKLFSGGFVGVDVFFVISGYLITSIILAELQAGKFTLVGFYERRARRILPALFLVMLTCIPFAWFWMLPSELIAFSKSLIAVSLYISNILFWSESGYFEGVAELKPMLHTWSLAVEEQFYLLYPLFLLIVWRCKKNQIIAMLAILATLSLLLAQFGSIYKPVPTFFLLPTRGFELIIGTFVALHKHNSSPNNNSIRKTFIFNQMMGLTGLALVLYATFVFDKATPFPSFYTLVPTVGTALIINYATSDSLVGRWLGNRILVAVGLISYSAYLWHQPLFAFARLRSFDKPSALLLVCLAISAVILAYFSWKFIESPFRNKQLTSRKFIFTFSAITSLFMISIGIAGYRIADFDSRKFADGTTYRDIDYRIRANVGLNERCSGKSTFSSECRTTDKPEIAVWGDSFAMHLVQGILASNPSAQVAQMTWSFCGPFHELAPFNGIDYNEEWAKQCIDFNNQVLESITKTPSIKYVVLASPFDQYTSGNYSFLTKNGTAKFAQEIVVQSFIETLQLLTSKGITPVVFSPPPSLGIDVGHCIVNSKFFNSDPKRCDISLTNPNDKLNKVVNFLTEIDKKFNVVWLNTILCNNSVCNSTVDGQIIYKDSHFSYEGSTYVGKKMNFYKLITEHESVHLYAIR